MKPLDNTGHGARHHRYHHPERPPHDGDSPGERGRRPGGRHGGGPRRGRGRAPRGDVRAAILLLLADEPMHGYQLMQSIAERSGGRWTPSPGAIYPALALLEDEGLVAVTASSGRKVATLTDAGREVVRTEGNQWPDPFASDSDVPPGPDLRRLLEQVHDATRQIGRSGTVEQREAAGKLLSQVRRDLYLILADSPND